MATGGQVDSWPRFVPALLRKRRFQLAAGLSVSPTMTLGKPQMARDACKPDITAASAHPTFNPLAVQSPASQRLSNPDLSLFRRYLELPGTLST